MILYRGIGDPLQTRALRSFLFKAYMVWMDHWFDIRNGTDTNGILKLDNLSVQGANRDQGGPYQATRAVPLERLFRQIGSLIPLGKVLVDFGCGKGRVLLIASSFGFQKAIGIEFAKELCTIARRNCEVYRRFRGAQTAFEIIESDAADYPVHPDENVFFLYNPFGEPVMKKVLDNIDRSIHEAPRKVLVIYYNPHLDHVFEGRFARVMDFYFGHYHFLVYSNRDP